MTSSTDGAGGDSGVSVWVLVGVAVAAVALIAVVVFLVFSSPDDDSSGAVATTTTELPPTTEQAASSTSVAPTTAVVDSTTTTTPPTDNENPFVGWWKSADSDGRSVDFRVDTDGGIFFWDSASILCVNDGTNFPYAMEGFSTFKPFGTPTLAVSGSGTCHPYGTGQHPKESPLFVLTYDADTDMIESADDGTMYVRSPSVPGHPSDDSNPFVGSWEGTDSDMTHVEMVILDDGSWQSTDTRSGGCERKGFTYATWSADGSGIFDLGAAQTFEIALTTYCHPVGEEKLVHSPEASFVLSYNPSTDTLALDGTDVEYTRLP